jgi:hypothetical protein
MRSQRDAKVVSGAGTGETEHHRHGQSDRQGDAGSVELTAFKGPRPGRAVAGRGTVAGDGVRGQGVAKWHAVLGVAGWAIALRSHGGLASQSLRRARLTPAAKVI